VVPARWSTPVGRAEETEVEGVVTDKDVREVVVDAWRVVLQTATVEGDDDFFELGGDSMGALALAERIESELGIQFPLEMFFLESRLDTLVAECRRLGSPAE
jgi:phthiocerol/phenolphthiocerol synthesis type-I polyketide synthase E